MSAPVHAKRPLGLWDNDAFRRLYAAQVISLLGSGVTTVGLALFAYQLEGGSAATAVLGNALMLRILAFLLFSQPAGVLADRVDRKKILVAADLARVGMVGLFPFITATWQIYALVFVLNAVTAFFTPTFEASIPDVVGREQYVGALSVARVAVDVEAVAAPALAGLLVAVVGLRWVFWFDAATYLASALLVMSARVPRPSASPAKLPARDLLAEISRGTRVLLREPSLRQALALSIVEATAGAAAIVVTVAYVHDVLGGGDSAVAWLMAAVGLGSTLTALCLGRATRRYEQGAPSTAELHGRRHAWAARALVFGGLLAGLVLVPGAWEPPLVVFALLWAASGAGQALIAIPSSTLLAEHTCEEERGRAFAAHFALTHACWLITYPVLGHAAARWGAPSTITGAGIACICVTAAAAATSAGTGAAHTHDHDRDDASRLRSNEP